jgi:hypothetical protein
MYTYLDKRKCLYCENPIPDQFSKARKFCLREVLPDGSIKNCKDDYHVEKNKELESRCRQLNIYQKKMNERIELLFKSKGDSVKLEDLNRAGINLFRPLQFEYINGMYRGWFLDFVIENTTDNNFKIFRNEYILQ